MQSRARKRTEQESKKQSSSNVRAVLPAERRRKSCGCCEVMVCDDLYMNIIVLKQMLDHLGIIAEEAQSGQICLDKLAQPRPCMCPFYKYLLLDYSMPGVSGIDVIKEIKERAKKMEIYAKLRIIVVTGGGQSDHEIRELHGYGVHDIIIKPISLQKLKVIFNIQGD